MFKPATMKPQATARHYMCHTCNESIYVLRPTAAQQAHRKSIMNLPYSIEWIDHVGYFRATCAACGKRQTTTHYLVELHAAKQGQPKFF